MAHQPAAHYPGVQDFALHRDANGNLVQHAALHARAAAPAGPRHDVQPLQRMAALGDDPRRLDGEYLRQLDIEFFGPNEPAGQGGANDGANGYNGAARGGHAQPRQFAGAAGNDFHGHAQPVHFAGANGDAYDGRAHAQQLGGAAGNAFHGHAQPEQVGGVNDRAFDDRGQPRQFAGNAFDDYGLPQQFAAANRDVYDQPWVRPAPNMQPPRGYDGHNAHGAQLPPFRLDGRAKAAQAPARHVPVGQHIAEELDRARVHNPVVIGTVDISFTVDEDGCAFKQVLSVPEDRDPFTIRRNVCRRMGLDPASARLGYKTSRDKAKELPRSFHSHDDIASAIKHVNELKKSARSKAVEMVVIDLKAPAAAGKEKKKPSKKRSAQSTVDNNNNDDEATVSIEKNSPQMKILRRSLLCANPDCETPGEAGRNKYCRVLPDGTHEWVSPPQMSWWAMKMAVDPENVNPMSPPSVKTYDFQPRKPRAQKASNVPNININISRDLLLPSPAKRQCTVTEESDSSPRKVKKEEPRSPPRKVKKESSRSPSRQIKKEELRSPSRRVKKEEPRSPRLLRRMIKDPEVIDLTLSDDVEIIEVPAAAVKAE